MASLTYKRQSGSQRQLYAAFKNSVKDDSPNEEIQQYVSEYGDSNSADESFNENRLCRGRVCGPATLG